jgi:hypothetical protein
MVSLNQHRLTPKANSVTYILTGSYPKRSQPLNVNYATKNADLLIPAQESSRGYKGILFILLYLAFYSWFAYTHNVVAHRHERSDRPMELVGRDIY